MPAFQPTLPLPPCGWRPLDDHTLWRFLVADRRKGAFDRPASAKRLASALLWRKEETVDTLIEEPPDAAVKVLGLSVAAYPGTTSDDRCIIMNRLGEQISSGNLKSFSQAEMAAHAIRQLERSAWQMRYYASELGRSVDHVTVIMDMTTVMNSLRNIKVTPSPHPDTASHHADPCPPLRTQHFVELSRDFSAHYPELLASTILINCPATLSGFYNGLAKRLLDPAVAAKVQLHSKANSAAALHVCGRSAPRSRRRPLS